MSGASREGVEDLPGKAVDKMRVIFVQNAGFVAAFSPSFRFRYDSVMLKLAALGTGVNLNEAQLSAARAHPQTEG